MLLLPHLPGAGITDSLLTYLAVLWMLRTQTQVLLLAWHTLHLLVTSSSLGSLSFTENQWARTLNKFSKRHISAGNLIPVLKLTHNLL